MSAATGSGCWQGRAANGQAVEVRIEDGVILSVACTEEKEDLPWISAGWIDLQVNGANGGDFNGQRTTLEDVDRTTRYLWTKGVTRYLPTVITGSFERMNRAMAAIAEAAAEPTPLGRTIGGIHMEGPYLSGERGPRGAHDARQVRDPDPEEFERLQRSAGGRIVLVTLAPEREGAIPFVRELAGRGIVVSIGHSAASGEQIASAAEAGASMSTHLGNGSHLMLPRHPNYLWEQLADERLISGFIADGHHLPLSTLKAMLRAKGEQAFVVSDCVSLAGMPPGEYKGEIGERVVLREDGRLYLADDPGILAGSASTLEKGIETLVGTLRYSLADAIALVTERPAKAMGWQDFGRLEPGLQGNLTLFECERSGEDASVRIVETVVAGESVYRQAEGGPFGN
ncbi:N-acetylglucosamine-6-phosphate deacetylase [Cohnella sp.]|uniref:N-acetylglucosamine-6-phosphate deacetylase n=1 Tax=Cohnella sp. TaxID=1883426 RepID=UPI0035625048